MKYEYSIKPYNSPEDFELACMEFEKSHPDARKERLLVDVDGSTIQIYHVDAGKIKILDEYFIDAVYAEADFLIPQDSELGALFKLVRTGKRDV